MKTMNYIKPFICFLFLTLFISACSHDKQVTSSTQVPFSVNVVASTKTNPPKIPTMVQTKTFSSTPLILSTPTGKASSTAFTEATQITPLDKKDYIIYFNQVPNTKHWGTFALHPGENQALLFTVTEASLSESGLSPDQKYWLFNGDSILLSDRNGSNFQKVFSDPKYKLVVAFWISNSKILINAYEELGQAPHLFLCNIVDRKVQQIIHPGKRVVLASFPPIGVAIEKDYSTNEIYQLDQDGKEKKILEEFQDIHNFFHFSPVTKELFIYGIKNGENIERLWAISMETMVERPIYPMQDYEINQSHLSPDGKYVAFTAFSSLCGSEACVGFINIMNGELEYRWTYPYWPNNETFFWSPDSRQIALPYDGHTNAEAGAPVQGIQVMDISTGKIQLIWEKNIIGIIAWINLK